jgi:hypothetical protein
MTVKRNSHKIVCWIAWRSGVHKSSMEFFWTRNVTDRLRWTSEVHVDTVDFFSRRVPAGTMVRKPAATVNEIFYRIVEFFTTDCGINRNNRPSSNRFDLPNDPLKWLRNRPVYNRCRTVFYWKPFRTDGAFAYCWTCVRPWTPVLRRVEQLDRHPNSFIDDTL